MLRPRLSAIVATLGLLVAVPSASALGEQPAPAVVTTTAPTVFSPDQVIVQWTASADHGDKVEARAGAEVDFSADLGNRDFQLVKVEPGQTPGAAVAGLRADPAVAAVERDGYDTPEAVPNDPLFGQLWGLRNLGLNIDGASGSVAGDDIGAVAAWDRTVGSPSVVIADLDSGYRFEDPDLGPVAWKNPGEIAGNGIDDDGNGFIDDVRGWDFVGADGDHSVADNDPTDDDLISGGHGVHTAGTMGAAGNNGVGITGVARNVRIMPLRICTRFDSLEGSRCPFSAEVAAINYAGEMGARAANMSLGGTTREQLVANALAANPGTLFVIAAGNDSVNNETTHHYPCDFNPAVDASPAVPGAIDNVICVAATNQADGLASFSDYGAASVDLGAPGTETLSTYPGQETPISDDFEANDFSSRWTSGGAGFGRAASGDGPLTSFGMTDSPGAAPAAGSVHEVTLTTGAPLPAGAGGCTLSGKRYRSGGSGGTFFYQVLSDGVPAFTNTSSTASPTFAMETFNTVPIENLGGHVIKLRFGFTAGASPTAADGIWLDDLKLHCYAPLSAPLSYEFLQGTSMATPHVTGAAGLLFSLEPTASVTEVREALLKGTDPTPSLAGKTVTGGRLDIPVAMDVLEPPKAPLLSSTNPVSPANDWNPRILGFAKPGSTVKIFTGGSCAGAPTASGSAEMLGSLGIQVTVRAETTATFSANATDANGKTSTCSLPISYTNTATIGPSSVTVTTPPNTPHSEDPPHPPTSPPVSCTVPKLAGRSLGQATSDLAGAGCKLGNVAKPKARKGHKLGALVVKSSNPAAGATTSGAVNLTLGPKPKKQHH